MRNLHPFRTLIFILPFILALTSLNTWAGGFDENTLKELQKLSQDKTLPAQLQKLVEVALSSDAKGKEIESQGEEKKTVIEEKGVINERSLRFYKYANKAKELIDKVQGVTPKHKNYETYLEEAQTHSNAYVTFEDEILNQNQNQNQDNSCPREILDEALRTPGMPEKIISYLDPASQRCVAQVSHLFNRASKESSRLEESLEILETDKRPLREILNHYPNGSRMKKFSYLTLMGFFRRKLSEDDLKLIVTKFPRLSSLMLSGLDLPDAGLVGLKELKHLTTLDLFNTKVTGAGLVHVKELKQLTTLVLAMTEVTDAGLVLLKDLEQLSSLNLLGTKLTGAGLVGLKELKHLTTLNLAHTRVTDAELAHVKELKQLSTLDLEHTKVTGNGLVDLKELKQLIHLGLANTKVRDAGLVDLKELKHLTTLYLYDSKVTDAGIAKLRKFNPNLKIVRDLY